LFERPHHRRIATVLEALDADWLAADADRWHDDAVMSRDLIDLAMMTPSRSLMKQALAKARGAYGDSVAVDLARAVEDLRKRPHRLDRCMQAMAMTTLSRAALWARIRNLVR